MPNATVSVPLLCLLTITRDVTISGPDASLPTLVAGHGTDAHPTPETATTSSASMTWMATNQINVTLSGLTLTGGDNAFAGGAVFCSH